MRPARWIKLTEKQWRVVHRALAEYAERRTREGVAAARDGARTQPYTEAADAARAVALAIGYGGELAAYLGVRPAGKPVKYRGWDDPRTDYLDREGAAGLIERCYRAAPGAWVADANPDAVAAAFLLWCHDRCERPDARSLDRYLEGHPAWTPENAAR